MKSFNSFKEDHEKRAKSAIQSVGNTALDYFSGGGDLKGFGKVLKGAVTKQAKKHKKPVLKQLKKDFNTEMSK